VWARGLIAALRRARLDQGMKTHEAAKPLVLSLVKARLAQALHMEEVGEAEPEEEEEEPAVIHAPAAAKVPGALHEAAHAPGALAAVDLIARRWGLGGKEGDGTAYLALALLLCPSTRVCVALVESLLLPLGGTRPVRACVRACV
jgi:hypothetical protein